MANNKSSHEKNRDGSAAEKQHPVLNNELSTEAVDSSADQSSQIVTSSSTSAEFLDGVAIADAIKTGDMTPVEAVQEAIRRTKATQSQLNAVAFEGFDSALKEASELTDLRPRFAGVPTFTKDTLNVKGQPNFLGSRSRAEALPEEEDETFIKKWRDAGIVFVGRSTMPEFGMLPCSTNLLHGSTHNPWGKNLDAAGSSGGAAALVAARVVPFAHASDIGGSIRLPSSVCGLFGFKPSRNRLGVEANASKLDIVVHHACTISVRDSIELFRIAEGGDFPPITPSIEPIDRPLRIGLWLDSPNRTPVDPEIEKIVNETAKLCESLGHIIEEFVFDLEVADQFRDHAELGFAARAAARVATHSKAMGVPVTKDYFGPYTLKQVEVYQQRQAELPEAIQKILSFQSFYEKELGVFDLILSPTNAIPTPPLTHMDPRVDVDTLNQRVEEFCQFTIGANLSGAPSMSVPLGTTTGGLPAGSLFSAREGDDELLFRLALQLEEASPWINIIPPLNALEFKNKV
ncbi:MAG: amidase family protein [Pseudomonadota bacterium]